jgi:hypothetical protein
VPKVPPVLVRRRSRIRGGGRRVGRAVDVQVCQRCGFGDRLGQRTQRSGVGDAALWAVLVVVVFVLA